MKLGYRNEFSLSLWQNEVKIVISRRHRTIQSHELHQLHTFSENLNTSVTRDISMEMIENPRKQVEKYKQDVSERYQEKRRICSGLRAR